MRQLSCDLDVLIFNTMAHRAVDTGGLRRSAGHCGIGHGKAPTQPTFLLWRLPAAPKGPQVGKAAIPHRGGHGRESLKIGHISKVVFPGMAAFTH